MSERIQWTRAQEDGIVLRAVEFIRRQSREAAMDFSIEVGRHLFEGLFDGRIELLRSNRPWKRRAIARIARDPRVKLSENILFKCVHVHLLVEKYGRHHPGLTVPDISPAKWDNLWRLHDDEVTFFKVLSWAERTGASEELIAAVVQTLSDYVASGGRIEDLLVDPSRYASSRTPYGRIRRMLGIERSWVEKGTGISKKSRRKALELVERIMRELEKGRSTR